MKSVVRWVSILSLLAILCAKQLCYGQSAIDLKGLNLDSSNIAEWYDSQIGLENTQLQLGIRILPERRALKGHPYYAQDSWIQGTIKYRGQTFYNVAMLYDLYSDQVVIRENGSDFSNNLIQLYKTQVDEFNMLERHFERHADIGDQEGFYELTYAGKNISLYTRRTKVVELEPNKITAYHQKERYFVLLNDQYNQLRSKSTLYKLLKAHKRELKKLVRKENLTLFKLDSDLANRRLMNYCDSLLD